MKLPKLPEAKIALNLAEIDFEAAIILIKTDDLHQISGLHLQQATEKLIKTLIYLNGGSFEISKGHRMGHLRERLGKTGFKIDPRFDSLDVTLAPKIKALDTSQQAA